MNKLAVLIAGTLLLIGNASVQANTIEIENAAQYKGAINGPHTVVMIYSGTCPHCIKMLPIFEQVSNTVRGPKDIKFIKLEASKPSLAGPLSTLNVRGVPAFKVFKNGQLAQSTGGEQSASQLAEFARK